MSSSKRALRRHHRARLNNRTRFIVTKVWYWAKWDEDNVQHWVARSRDNMKRCSCSGCCNERNKRSWTKSWKRQTLQEMRMSDSELCQWEEYEEDVFNM